MALLALGEDPAPWGFLLTPEEAAARIKEYLKEDLDYWIRWNFLCIKRKLARMRDQGKDISEHARWLLDISLNEKIDWEHCKHKQPVDWQSFKDLAPKDVKIPYVKQLRLNADEVEE